MKATQKSIRNNFFPLLCHTNGISKEGMICWAASFSFFRDVKFGANFNAYFYDCYGNKIGQDRANFAEVESLGSFFGREVSAAFSYAGHLEPMHLITKRIQFPDYEDFKELPPFFIDNSGSHLVLIDCPRIENLFWISNREINFDQVKFGECFIQVRKNDLSWSTNMVALAINEEVRARVRKTRNYMKDYYSIEDSHIELGSIIPYYVRQQLHKRGFLFVREQRNEQTFICEYFSPNGLHLAPDEILISKATLPKSGFFMPKWDKEKKPIILPEFPRRFMRTIGIVKDARASISPVRN